MFELKKLAERSFLGCGHRIAKRQRNRVLARQSVSDAVRLQTEVIPNLAGERDLFERRETLIAPRCGKLDFRAPIRQRLKYKMCRDFIGAAIPIDELRERFRTQPGELRGYLTVVPETRWVKHPSHLKSFHDETIAHYADHSDDLAAILSAAGR